MRPVFFLSVRPLLTLALPLTRTTPARCCGVRSERCSEIVERVLCKASRTTSGSDSYFTVEQLFTNSDYLLKKRSERLPPINVEVGFESLMAGCIHRRCVLLVSFRRVGVLSVFAKSVFVSRDFFFLYDGTGCRCGDGALRPAGVGCRLHVDLSLEKEVAA